MHRLYYSSPPLASLHPTFSRPSQPMASTNLVHRLIRPRWLGIHCRAVDMAHHRSLVLGSSFVSPHTSPSNQLVPNFNVLQSFVGPMLNFHQLSLPFGNARLPFSTTSPSVRQYQDEDYITFYRNKLVEKLEVLKTIPDAQPIVARIEGVSIILSEVDRKDQAKKASYHLIVADYSSQ